MAATNSRSDIDTLAETRAVFEHSSDIVTIVEADGTWRSTSPAGTRLLGWPPGYTPTADGMLEFVHDDDRELATTALGEVLAGTRSPDDPVVIRVHGADGRWHHLETRGRDLRDDPTVRGIVLTSRDVTKQRTAEERVQLLSRVLETSHELVVLCDPRGRVLYANDIARNEYGVVEGGAPVKLANSLFSAYEDQLTAEVMPGLQNEGAWSGESSCATSGVRRSRWPSRSSSTACWGATPSSSRRSRTTSAS